MKKAKKLFISLLLIICMFALTGCQDYRGLDQLTIVAGMAIDQSEKDPNKFTITFEILDNENKNSNDPVSSKLISSEGSSVFEAMSNANSQLESTLYYGNAEVVVLSEQLAKNGALADVLDTFLRDYYIRDSIFIIISQEESAKKLFQYKEDENQIVSFNLKKNMADTEFTTESTHRVPIYRAYSTIIANRTSLTLPVFRFFPEKTDDQDEKGGGESQGSQEKKPEQEDKSHEGEKEESNEKLILMSDGLAIFEKEKMVSHFDESELVNYLLCTENLQGGRFIAFLDDDDNFPRDTVSLALGQTQKKLDFSYENGKLTLFVNIHLDSGILGISTKLNRLSQQDVLEISELCSEQLNQDITNMIQKIQKEKGQEIFGFADTIYRKDFKLWEQLSSDWTTHFSKADIVVTSEVSIEDTGMINGFYQVEGE